MGKLNKLFFSPGAGVGALSSSSGMNRRDWSQIYAIYGLPERHTMAFLLFHSAAFASASLLLLLHFPTALALLSSLLPSRAPSPLPRFLLGFAGSVAAITSLCLLYAAASLFHSSLSLHWDMCQRVVAAVPDWSAVRTALDVGCGRGILLNSVAMQLKKGGSRGRVVGLDHRRETAVAALRTACVEGVQDYVTCREGDCRRLPFADGYFDVVVSAVHLSGVGRGEGKGGSSSSLSAAAAGERGKGLGEVVRVLKPGGVGVVWDLGWVVPECVQRLREMRMEDIRVSERVTAYLAASHIVSFRKPQEGGVTEQQQQQQQQQQMDWRANILC